MSHTVNVSGISSSTKTAQLHDFFTISTIEYKEGSSTATISFEKPNAAKTALMLNGGALDGSTLSVTSDVEHQDVDHNTPGVFEQSDKPRAGIAAEYIAKGYVLSDHILQQAIEIDNKQGISKRFLDFFRGVDKSVGEKALGPDQTVSQKLQATVGNAAQRARAVDEERGFSKTAQDYYQRAISSPFGQKVQLFYTDTSKQVKDIHEEARRIADAEKGAHAESTHNSSSTQTEEAANTSADIKQSVPTVI
ncbi:hypothetical protein HYPSUDRAFT_55611 [Hypholoma sublateritium FD-334 SS-4]|uniref:RRM domain-containing protein n=1 Tax=Hypholoma sublateritium (strain FD-334 SS-4) TaxID=945553 RepID=A0A0D2NXE3_HYPSF|nr:hypothetical protein HYPSUDRAFT_55611 [Hypholoma sublateritium FD-334 SS-4]